METFEPFTYSRLASTISIIAGVIGLVWSIIAVILGVRKNRTADKSGDERQSVTWNPVQYVFAFAILWPALIPLGPFMIYLDRRKDPEAIEIATAEAQKKGEWPPVPTADRLLYGGIAGIMLLYVVGLFVFD